MKGKHNLSKIMLTIASLALGTGAWASSGLNMITDPITGVFETTSNLVSMPVNTVAMPLVGMQKGWHMDGMRDADYLVTDSHHGKVMYLDGVDKCHKVNNVGHTNYNYNDLKGDKLTNLHTNKSGLITGVKDQGTMEVMKANGHTVQYNYVTFKVKPL